MWKDFQGKYTVPVSQITFRKHRLSCVIQIQKNVIHLVVSSFSKPPIYGKVRMRSHNGQHSVSLLNQPQWKPGEGLGLVSSVLRTVLADFTLTDLEFGHWLACQVFWCWKSNWILFRQRILELWVAIMQPYCYLQPKREHSAPCRPLILGGAEYTARSFFLLLKTCQESRWTDFTFYIGSPRRFCPQ